MNPDPTPSAKYLREHTPSLDDLIFTKREFLIRTGMGFGAMSLASMFGVNPFLPGGAHAATTAKLV